MTVQTLYGAPYQSTQTVDSDARLCRVVVLYPPCATQVGLIRAGLGRAPHPGTQYALYIKNYIEVAVVFICIASTLIAPEKNFSFPKLKI